MKIILRVLQIIGKYGWGAILLSLAVFAVGFTWSSSNDLYSSIRIFDKIALTISSSYVENIDQAKMVQAGIDGMVSRLDPYSKFLTGADFLYLMQETDGQFDGIGISLEFHHDSLTVESVLEGTPGYYQGLRPGDKIISIGDSVTTGRTMREIKMLLNGPRGSRVNLHIHRPGEIGFDISIERQRVDIKAVPYYGLASKSVGYIRLARFSQRCSDEVRVAILDLESQKIHGLILDLRDNPGGLLTEAIEIAGMFLPKGSKIVETRSRDGELGAVYRSKKEPIFRSGGLAIIVDGQTASAAEIVAGAIQDHDRGVIVGSSTFGKGLVQQVMQFTDDSALKLTTSKYYMSSGRCLQKPDWSSFELLAGKPDQITDSLYKTDSGRPVFGNGGIIPDIYIDTDSISPYVDAIAANSYFFDYALEYVKDHKIESGFKIDDSVISDFRRFLKSKKFQYKDEAQGAFEKFKDKISRPDPELTEAMAIINRKLVSRESLEFDSNYVTIGRQLQEAIIQGGLGEKALYAEVWIPTQTEIAQAINIISDGDRYTNILAVH